jgi:hypothetical protein
MQSVDASSARRMRGAGMSVGISAGIRVCWRDWSRLDIAEDVGRETSERAGMGVSGTALLPLKSFAALRIFHHPVKSMSRRSLVLYYPCSLYPDILLACRSLPPT